jgi:C-1 hydroxylase
MNRRLMLARREEAIAAWNRHDPDAVVAHVADDVIFRDVAFRMPLQGRSALKKAIEDYMAAFPDVHVQITSTTVDGPRIVQEWTVTATHRGDFMGVPATGRWTENYGATVTTFDDDGMVIEASMYWNPLGLCRQPDESLAAAVSAAGA